MLHRAYSFVDIKEFDGTRRTFSGIATHPEPDRMGDVIEPKGVKFAKTIPLLLYHDSHKPVGESRFSAPTKDGIPFNAVISKVDRPGIVNDRINEAIDSLNANPPLIRAVSIGFKALEEPQYIKETGGVRFPSIEVLELSMVVIPANERATIQVVKSFDTTSGQSATDARVSSRNVPPAAVGRRTHGDARMTTNATPISDQLTAASAELKTKSARLEELVIKQGADGDLEDAEQTELVGVRGSVEKLSERIKNLKALEDAQLQMARPVYKAAPDRDVRDPDAGRVIVGDGTEQKLPKGIEFARTVMCQMEAHRRGVSSVEIAKQFCRDTPRVAMYLKEDVPAASTLDSTWAGPLVYAQNLVSEFVEFLRPQTIIGRIDSFTRVPFNVRVTGQTSGGSGYWVGELRAKPLTFWNTNAQTLRWAKVANIAVISQELARFSNPSAEAYVRDELARACRERLDIDFIDPDKAAVANVSPASITNGIPQLNSTATTTLADIQAELASMMAPFAQWNIVPTHWIMPNTVAMKLSVFLTSLGNPAFPNINMNGGTLMGLPVITSQYLISGTPSNNLVILLSAPEIFLADDGGFTVDVSREASLEMNDAPTMSGGSLGSPAGASGSVVVSMFQINAMAIRCERFINWSRRRGTTSPGVVWMDDVAWGGAIPS